jgi:hypothetical protein
MAPGSEGSTPRNYFRRGATIAGLLALVVSAPAEAQTSWPDWAPHLLAAQATFIGQALASFHSPYSGSHSLVATGDQEMTDTYGVYLGAGFGRGLHTYLDVEMARGEGIGHAVGLAGITNGDVIRQGTADLSRGPYVARLFLQYSIPLGRDSEPVERGADQFPGWQPANRIDLAGGKLAASDFFDLNRYANSTRQQFLDWGLFQNTAWDFAADTRGYTYGLVVQWSHPAWTFRAGSFLMPTQANGNQFDTDVRRARGDNVELELRPGAGGTVVRILGYRNAARMGIYREAIANAPPGASPDIAADDRPGRSKYGFGLNLEQPLADSGETGAFLRAGWNDGKTESFAFTEVDREVSAGVQLTGRRWRRHDDRLGVAFILHGLSADHRDYLALGGSGFLLGDGRLNYGAERITELYYRVDCGRALQLSPDLQLIANPGYNRDRGPARVVSLRAAVRY